MKAKVNVPGDKQAYLFLGGTMFEFLLSHCLYRVKFLVVLLVSSRHRPRL